ncbi:MAG TPA: hypothetical protein VGL19_05885 [Polyangiaceae bacterium]
MPGEVGSAAPALAPELRDSRRAGGIGHRAVFLVFACTVAAAFVGGVLIYFKFVAYGRVAARHLPNDTVLAARLDVETVLIADPVRVRLLPLFDQGVPEASDLRPRHDRFRAHTGVELGRDLREVVVGISKAGWVVVFGGKFPRTGLVAGLSTTLDEEHTAARFAGGVLQVQAGPAVGQASDGALIVASDSKQLQAALTGGEAYLRLGLPPEGAGGFGLLVSDPAPPGFADFASVSGSVQLGSAMLVDVAVRLRPGVSADPASVARAFATLGEAVPALSQAQRPLENAQITPRRPDEVGVSLSWTRPELDAGASWLGGLLRAQFARARARP